MDKKSNRTDLLAAGRKKLQQYRQKKDSKGKDGKGSCKSANKVDQSEQSDGASGMVFTSPKTKAESSICEGEVEFMSSVLSISENLVNSSVDSQMILENSASTSSGSQITDESPLPVLGNITQQTVLDVNAHPPDSDAAPPEASLNDQRNSNPSSEQEDFKTGGHEVEGFVLSGSTDAETVGINAYAPISDSTTGAACRSEALAAVFREAEGSCEGDQVSVVGTMQKAESLVSKRCDQSIELKPGREGKISLIADDGSCEFRKVSNDISQKLVPWECDQNFDVSDVEINECCGHHETVEASDPVKTTHIGTETISSLMHQRGEDIMDGSSCGNTPYLQFMVNDFSYYESEANRADLGGRVDKGFGEQCLYEVSSMVGVKSDENLIENRGIDFPKEQSMCPGVEGNNIDLSKLAELLKQLSEDDFRCLVKSRKSVDYSNPVVCGNEMAAFPETFQEHLYLANILSDIFYLQLHEQQEEQIVADHLRRPLLDETPVLTPSLLDVQERNKKLAAELSQSRSELEVAIREKVELQNLCGSAKEDVLQYSDIVDELKTKLEESMGHLSSLSGEFTNCKVLLETSQGENEKLKENLASVTEQRKKFEDVEEQYVYENRKLSTDLADRSAQLDALQQEIANLCMSLASVNDEKKKLKGEKEFLVHEKETLLRDLADCKLTVATLQQENADLNLNFGVVTEERDKLKEHEEFLSKDIEKLSVELVVSQEKLSIQQEEHAQLEVDLKETMSRLELLTEENIILQSNLEFLKVTMAEVGSQQTQISSQIGSVSPGSTADVDSSLRILVKEAEPLVSSVGPASDVCTGLSQLRFDLYDEASGVVALKGCLEKAEKVVRNLEKAVDGMHAQSACLSRSASKAAAAAGVSKLIQAFDLKTDVDGSGPEGTSSPGSLLSFDLYSSSKELLSQLRLVFNSLVQNVEHANALIIQEQGSHSATIAVRGELLVEIETLKEFISNLELRNIELEVLCETMKYYVHDIDAKRTGLFESLRGQEVLLNEIRRSAGEVASVICNEVETLQRETRQDIYAVDRKWKSALTELVLMVEKLDTVVGCEVSHPHHHNDNGIDLDIFGYISLSLHNACEVIEQLKMRLDATGKDHEALYNSYMEVTEKLHGCNEEHNLAIGLLQKFSDDLVHLLSVSGELVGDGGFQIRDNKPHNSLDASYYKNLVAKLSSLLGDMLQLKESQSKSYFDLLNRTNQMESKKSSDGDELLKIILDVKEVLKLQDAVADVSEPRVVSLQPLVLLLIQKYKEAEELANVLSNEYNNRLVEFGVLQCQVELLESLNFQQQNEVLILRESLIQAKDASEATQAELLEKVRELEQSEQRVASVREKLSIAVAKGKGLVVQRDSLKQSLTEISSELEKCSQELRQKDSKLHELEEKLKVYSEAGERMEALESELSYIRNSATALRESFLLKDSTLQRIEEILEDLELPEQFHSKDITEKIDWLAKSAAGNSLPPTDWDQRSSVGGGSYSDAGCVVTDGRKEDIQPTLDPIDDFRKQYDELQTKFYELAEQNEMLEQSLMERNVLVQRWEEILDRINTPSQIRSMEPEERIHWLGTALSEADHHMRSLQLKVENLENYCRSLSGDLEGSQRKMSEQESSFRAVLGEKEGALSEAEGSLKSLLEKNNNLENYCGLLSFDLEESQRRISELESSLQEVLYDKETLSSNLVALTSDRERAFDMGAQHEREVGRLAEEVDMLQSKLVDKLGNEDRTNLIENEVRRLQSLILDVLQDSVTENVPSDVSDIQYLERLVGRLVNHVATIDAECHALREAVQEHATAQAALLVKEMKNDHFPDMVVASVDEPKSRSVVCEGLVFEDLKKELSDALDEVVSLREERGAFMQKNQSLVSAIEALETKMTEYKELFHQEEQKSASLREKLNLAVRKGKSLVQQRDGLKQNLEEMTNEIKQLKSEINNQELESGQKINDLSFQLEQCKAFETENLSLKSRLMETEQHLQQTNRTLSMFLRKLDEIVAGGEINAQEPVQKLEGLGKFCSDQHATAAYLEQEANKSKKAAELLLAELNEVQERNDSLQEEILRAYDEISSLSRARDLADSAKTEALSHLGNLSEERRMQLTEFDRLNSIVHEVKKGFFDIFTLIDDVFTKDKLLLHNLSTNLGSCLENIGAELIGTKDYDNLVSLNSKFEDFWSTNSSWDKLPYPLDESVEFDVFKVALLHLNQLNEVIGVLKERIHHQSMSLDRETDMLFTVISALLRSITSQQNSFESVKCQCSRLGSTVKEKDMENFAMRGNLSLLYEACISSIIEIENGKTQLTGHSLPAGDLRVNLPALPSADGENLSGLSTSYENCVKTLADKLLLAVKDFVRIGSGSAEERSKEMGSAIFNLQKELQEKDIQRERICLELASQIRETEVRAANYSRDLQSMKNYAQELESKLEAMGKEQSLLELRVAELQQGHSSSIELGKKVESLTGVVAAKEQEIEALMQALDEEENQMEALRSRVDELEKVVEQKSKDLQHAEASCAKAVKKLSVTVSKFDELHRMSEGLLSEIENLQSQLQGRDAEISFLRQEVTRCTNDALEATKIVKEHNFRELHEFLTWLDSMFSHVLMRDAHGGDENANHGHGYKEHMEKDTMAIISEVEELRVATQRKDALLQAERIRVEDLSRRKEALEVSLREKELHLKSLQDVREPGLGTSEIVEVEPVLNNWAVPVPSTASHVRSLRKVNNDQVAIAIDTDAGSSGRLEDDEDDKVHGFKSLTTSRFVPKFTRPVSDMIDGLWVSCDRTLMRQPAFRLGIMIYWALLHALLASLIV